MLRSVVTVDALGIFVHPWANNGHLWEEDKKLYWEGEDKNFDTETIQPALNEEKKNMKQYLEPEQNKYI